MSEPKNHTYQIEQVDIQKLMPYANNARIHSDEQVEQIVASIREFGFTVPVLIDGKNGIIAGHGRVLAARKLGLDEAPCIRLLHLTEEQKRAYVIADNKIALNSDWNFETLKNELRAITDGGMELQAMGFTVLEFEELLDLEKEEEKLNEEVLHEQSVQLAPDREYILVFAKTEAEWDDMIQFFALKKVRRGGYKKGSAFDAVGTERVLTFERVKNACRDTQ
jgi:ParB-like chromosome segregation protein Spo0J